MGFKTKAKNAIKYVYDNLMAPAAFALCVGAVLTPSKADAAENQHRLTNCRTDSSLEQRILSPEQFKHDELVRSFIKSNNLNTHVCTSTKVRGKRSDPSTYKEARAVSFDKFRVTGKGQDRNRGPVKVNFAGKVRNYRPDRDNDRHYRGVEFANVCNSINDARRSKGLRPLLGKDVKYIVKVNAEDSLRNGTLDMDRLYVFGYPVSAKGSFYNIPIREIGDYEQVSRVFEAMYECPDKGVCRGVNGKPVKNLAKGSQIINLPGPTKLVHIMIDVDKRNHGNVEFIVPKIVYGTVHTKKKVPEKEIPEKSLDHLVIPFQVQYLNGSKASSYVLMSTGFGGNITDNLQLTGLVGYGHIVDQRWNGEGTRDLIADPEDPFGISSQLREGENYIIAPGLELRCAAGDHINLVAGASVPLVIGKTVSEKLMFPDGSIADEEDYSTNEGVKAGILGTAGLDVMLGDNVSIGLRGTAGKMPAGPVYGGGLDLSILFK